MVQEVFPEGLIAQDGRLRPGDQIIEINGVDMTCANHLQVINLVPILLVSSDPFFVPNQLSICFPFLSKLH